MGQDRVQQQTKQEREKQCTLSSRDAPTTPSGGGSDANAGGGPGVPSLDGGSRYLLTPADSHPAHFTRGSLIQLASGQMKKVEQLDTEDFLSSAAHSPEVGLAIFLKKNVDQFNSCQVSIDQSTLIRLEPTQATGLCVLSFSVGKRNLQVNIYCVVVS